MRITPLLPVFALTLLPPIVTASDPAALLFGEHCASCHGMDGKARTPAGRKLRAHDLSQSTLSDVELVKQITNGRRNERGVERMPGFKEKLNPAEIDSLVAYVKSFRRTQPP